MNFTIRAITLDLDDTLWPFPPIGARIERVLEDWLRIHSPRTAERFPIAEMRALRERVFDAHPHLLHDMSALRLLTLEHAFRESGDDPALAGPAYDVFYAERNRVECYPDAIDALVEPALGRARSAELKAALKRFGEGGSIMELMQMTRGTN